VLRVGLTGVYGCGKSLAARMLQQEHAIPVVDMDLAGRAAAGRSSVLRRLRAAFGPGVFDAQGELNRSALGRIVFADPGERQKLNAIIHPAMLAIVKRQMQRIAAGRAPYMVVDSALIYELGFEKKVDLVVVVHLPLDLCLQRAMARDGISRAEVEERFNAQIAQAEKCCRADYLLDNSGTVEELRTRVAAMHTWLLERAEALTASLRPGADGRSANNSNGTGG